MATLLKVLNNLPIPNRRGVLHFASELRELIREAMKSIPANAFLAEVARQGESLGETRLGAVEGGVEAGDLRDLRRSFHDRAHGGEVVGLMQWREWLQLGESGEHSLGHPHRS